MYLTSCESVLKCLIFFYSLIVTNNGSHRNPIKIFPLPLELSPGIKSCLSRPTRLCRKPLPETRSTSYRNPKTGRWSWPKRKQRKNRKWPTFSWFHPGHLPQGLPVQAIQVPRHLSRNKQGQRQRKRGKKQNWYQVCGHCLNFPPLSYLFVPRPFFKSI